MGSIGAKAAGVQILSPAIGAKLEAIAAYRLDDGSKLLAALLPDLAVNFQGRAEWS